MTKKPFQTSDTPEMGPPLRPHGLKPPIDEQPAGEQLTEKPAGEKQPLRQLSERRQSEIDARKKIMEDKAKAREAREAKSKEAKTK